MPVTRKNDAPLLDGPSTLDFYAVGIPAACLVGAVLAMVLEWLR